MNDPNWANHTMWTGDNLNIMRSMNSESVDLIYLDPPFNSNRNFAAPIVSEVAGRVVQRHDAFLRQYLPREGVPSCVNQPCSQSDLSSLQALPSLSLYCFLNPLTSFSEDQGHGVCSGLRRRRPQLLCRPQRQRLHQQRRPLLWPNNEDKYVLWALYYGRLLYSDVNLLHENLEPFYAAIELELEFEKTREKYGMGTRVPKEGETTFFDILDLSKKNTLYVQTFIESILSEIPKLSHPLSLEKEHMTFLEAKFLFDEGVKSIHSGYDILEQGKLAEGLKEFEKADQMLNRFEESVLGVMKAISPGSVAYNDLLRYAERHKGRKVYYRGEVIQVIEDGNYFQLRVNITSTEYGWEDTVFLHYPDAPVRVLEGDEISFVGRVTGIITYESTMGSSVTIPELVAHELLIESE